eukprot:2513-Heterococcus_DN1.PRE.4
MQHLSEDMHRHCCKSCAMPCCAPEGTQDQEFERNHDKTVRLACTKRALRDSVYNDMFDAVQRG